jgi:hypothetical protein
MRENNVFADVRSNEDIIAPLDAARSPLRGSA